MTQVSVCVCVCVCVCARARARACVHAHTLSVRVPVLMQMCASLSTCQPAFLPASLPACICACVGVCLSRRACMIVHACMNAFVRACVCADACGTLVKGSVRVHGVCVCVLTSFVAMVCGTVWLYRSKAPPPPGQLLQGMSIQCLSFLQKPFPGQWSPFPTMLGLRPRSLMRKMVKFA